MVALMLVPAALSLIVLGAHFLRAGNLLLVALVPVLLVMLFVRRRWAALALQVSLLLGALEWAWTLAGLAARRIHAGEPVARLAIILGAVTLVTGVSGLLFSTGRLKRWYGEGPRESGTEEDSAQAS